MEISARTLRIFEVRVDGTRYVVEFHPKGIMIDAVRRFPCVVPDKQNQKTAVFYLLKYLHGQQRAEQWFDAGAEIKGRRGRNEAA